MYLKNGIEALGLDEKTDEGRRRIQQLKEGIVSELIDRALIEAEVTRRNLPVSNEALMETYQKAVAQIGGETAYRGYLAEHGLTDEEFRQTTAQECYSRVLRAELDKQAAVTEDEIRNFFNANQNNTALTDLFRRPEQVRASHILIAARRGQIAAEIQSQEKVNKGDLERRVIAEMAKRHDRAAELLSRLRRGADFRRLAAEHSDDAATRDRGGDLGIFTRVAHTAKFDEAAFALKPGRLSDIVETEFGYHIIKAREHSVERARTLDETRPEIKERLLAGKRAANLKAWLEARRRGAGVYVDPFYK